MVDFLFNLTFYSEFTTDIGKFLNQSLIIFKEKFEKNILKG